MAVMVTQASVVESLEGPNPKGQVCMDGIFDHHWKGLPTERIGNLLHGKRISGGPGPQPQNIDPVPKCQLHVPGIGHLGGDRKPCLLFHPPQPEKRPLPDPLETIRAGARLPHSGPKKGDPPQLQELESGGQ